MAQETQLGNIRKNKSKLLTAAIVLSLILIVTVGTSLAYLHISSDSVNNTFTPSDVTCEVEEKVSDGVKNSVQIKNTGTTTAYIRTAVIGNSVNESGDIIGPEILDDCLCGAGWVKNGMYYYYTQPVGPGELTGELLVRPIDLNGKQVTILAEAIQSVGMTTEGTKSVVDAWGFDPGTPDFK